MTTEIPRMKIAILGGSGKEGSGLALRWANAGHDVIIGSREAARANVAANEINALLGRKVRGAKPRALMRERSVV